MSFLKIFKSTFECISGEISGENPGKLEGISEEQEKTPGKQFIEFIEKLIEDYQGKLLKKTFLEQPDEFLKKKICEKT